MLVIADSINITIIIITLKVLIIIIRIANFSFKKCLGDIVNIRISDIRKQIHELATSVYQIRGQYPWYPCTIISVLPKQRCTCLHLCLSGKLYQVISRGKRSCPSLRSSS